MTDKRIDNYIDKSEVFASPILKQLRKLVHETLPDVVETIKWGFPHFLHNGAILCSMASFKKHCAFIFWNGKFLEDHHQILTTENKTSMGHLGKITSLKDLPGDKLMKHYIKTAADFDGTKIPVKKVPVKKILVVPEILTQALTKNKKAKLTFDNFSYSNQKDYVEWITEAKTEETREKRLTTTIEWLAEGKVRNWKHIKSK